MKYSIWIIPPEPIKTNLQNIIENLSTKYNGQIFEPHLTVFSTNNDKELSDVIKLTKKIADKTKPFKINLSVNSFSTTYFQNVLVRVTSSSDLLSLNLAFKNVFNQANDVYMPHISLLYGEQDMVTRERAVMTLPKLEFTFTANEIVVTPSVSDPAEWKHLETILLNG